MLIRRHVTLQLGNWDAMGYAISAEPHIATETQDVEKHVYLNLLTCSSNRMDGGNWRDSREGPRKSGRYWPQEKLQAFQNHIQKIPAKRTQCHKLIK